MSVINKYSADGITFTHSIDENPNDRSFLLHMHDYYELFCFVSGKASYVVEGNIYELRPGTVLIMRSSETHKLIVNGDEQYERFSVIFYPEVLMEKGLSKDLLAPFTKRPLGEKNVYDSNEMEHCRILDIIKKMYEECKHLPAETVLYHNLSCMLCAVAYVFANYPDGKIYVKERDLDRELLNYINDNITKELSIDEICNYVHISPTQLTRKFKELTGTTVYQYIIQKRLILAQRLIAKGKSAVMAAQESGFGDYSCFYRRYKKRFGHAPKDAVHRIHKD